MSSPIKSPQEELRLLTNQVNILIKTINSLKEKVDKCHLFTKDRDNIPIIPDLPKAKVPFIPKAIPIIDPKNPPISKVQLAALQSVLNVQGIEYNQLVKNAFISNNITVPDPIPSEDKLSYREAIIVIKYGNKKFRHKVT